MTKVPQKYIFWAAAAFALFLLCGAVFAASSLSTIKTAISSFCGDLVTLLPVATMMMVVVGSIIYASGQIMGAETRARANVWATAALAGALVGMLITAVAPPVLTTIYGSAVSCQSSASVDGCSPAGTACTADSQCCSNFCIPYGTDTCA